MNIRVEQDNFLPHCGAELSLNLNQDHINLIKGANGVGKSTLASFIKNNSPDKVTLVEQAPLRHFYNRKLIEVKEIFIKARPNYFCLKTLNQLWEFLKLERIGDHRVQNLSGGENQSLKLALGLSVKKDIVIIDEPSQFLDQERREKLASYLEGYLGDHFMIVIEHESNWLSGLPLKTMELFNDEKILRIRDV